MVRKFERSIDKVSTIVTNRIHDSSERDLSFISSSHSIFTLILSKILDARSHADLGRNINVERAKK